MLRYVEVPSHPAAGQAANVQLQGLVQVVLPASATEGGVNFGYEPWWAVLGVLGVLGANCHGKKSRELPT